MPRNPDLALQAAIYPQLKTVTASIRPIQTLPLVLGLLAVLGVAIQRSLEGWRPVAFWLIGLVLGLALYHASFGFASAYRRMIVARDMRGVQAQLLLLALTTSLFAPVLAQAEPLGQSMGGRAVWCVFARSAKVRPETTAPAAGPGRQQ